MKTQCSSMVGWQAIYLLAGCLAVLSPAAHAQGTRAVRTFQGGAGGGAGFQSVQEFDGSGPHRGFMVAIGGPGGSIDIGGSLLKTCDADQDGVATLNEVTNSLANWFQKADTDTNGALSEVEVEAALQLIFPTPQPPPGFPPPPEDLALPKLLAKKLMSSVDANLDAWITLKEATSFVEQSFPQWDSDGGGSLDASEFAMAFTQFMPPPEGGIRGGGNFQFRTR